MASVNKPKFFIRTYGCQMNFNDSERLARLLLDAGLVFAESEQDADLIIFNTCAVRDHAEQRIFGKMKDYIEDKKSGRKVVVAVSGCMIGRDKDGKLKKRLKPGADLFFTTEKMIDLPEMLAELRPDWSLQSASLTDYLQIKPLRNPSVQAYVAIQTGCNNFCTYCVVPYARGLERNRPLKDVLQEVKDAVNKGAKEIILLGQTVNSYQASDTQYFNRNNPYQNHFAALLWEVNNIDGVKRIHWTAPYPLQIHEQVIDALTLPKQVNYLHLPVQSGSNNVLRKMNRKYTREQYLEIIKRIKEKKPDIALGTDIIVGFPEETELDFQDTISLYKEVDFDISYTAQYSPRSGTLGYRLYKDKDIACDIKKKRWQELQDLMNKITARKNKKYQDRIIEVLVIEKKGGEIMGLNWEYKIVKAKGGDKVEKGDLVKVKISNPQTWQLNGEVVD